MTQRQCEGCRKIQNRDVMFKITKEHQSSKLFINPISKILGRSLYVCKNLDCIKNIIKKKRIMRIFKLKSIDEAHIIEKELLKLVGNAQ